MGKVWRITALPGNVGVPLLARALDNQTVEVILLWVGCISRPFGVWFLESQTISTGNPSHSYQSLEMKFVFFPKMMLCF